MLSNGVLHYLNVFLVFYVEKHTGCSNTFATLNSKQIIYPTNAIRSRGSSFSKLLSDVNTPGNISNL